MTVARHLPARTVYRCDICGEEGIMTREGEPETTWRRYSSIALDETCPDDVPTACGDQCIKELEKRLADGRIELPKLRATPGYFEVVRKGRGYPLIPVAASTRKA